MTFLLETVSFSLGLHYIMEIVNIKYMKWGVFCVENRYI